MDVIRHRRHLRHPIGRLAEAAEHHFAVGGQIERVQRRDHLFGSRIAVPQPEIIAEIARPFVAHAEMAGVGALVRQIDIHVPVQDIDIGVLAPVVRPIALLRLLFVRVPRVRMGLQLGRLLFAVLLFPPLPIPLPVLLAVLPAALAVAVFLIFPVPALRVLPLTGVLRVLRILRVLGVPGVLFAPIAVFLPLGGGPFVVLLVPVRFAHRSFSRKNSLFALAKICSSSASSFSFRSSARFLTTSPTFFGSLGNCPRQGTGVR